MLKEALRQFPAGRVLMVDEFRTSRVSSAYSNPSEALPGQPPESFSIEVANWLAMAGIVYWKLRSQLAFSTITFDGHFVSVGEAKRLIAGKMSLGPEAVEELVLTNPKTGQEHKEDSEQLAKGSSLIVRRVPPGQHRLRPLQTAVPAAGGAARAAPTQPAAHADTSAGEDEFGADPVAQQAEAVKAAQQAAAAAATAHREAAVASRGGRSGAGPGRGAGRGRGRSMPHANYVCPRCSLIGQHWVSDCPTQGDSNFDVRHVRQAAGIPTGKISANPDGSILMPDGVLGELSTNSRAYEQHMAEMMGAGAPSAAPQRAALADRPTSMLAIEAPPAAHQQLQLQHFPQAQQTLTMQQQQHHHHHNNHPQQQQLLPQQQQGQQFQSHQQQLQQQQLQQQQLQQQQPQQQPQQQQQQQQQQQPQLQQQQAPAQAGSGQPAALYDEDDDVLNAAAQPVKLYAAAPAASAITAGKAAALTQLQPADTDEALIRHEREAIPEALRRPFCTPKEFLEYLPLLAETLPVAPTRLLLKAFGAGLPLTPTEFQQLKEQEAKAAAASAAAAAAQQAAQDQATAAAVPEVENAVAATASSGQVHVVTSKPTPRPSSRYADKERSHHRSSTRLPSLSVEGSGILATLRLSQLLEDSQLRSLPSVSAVLTSPGGSSGSDSETDGADPQPTGRNGSGRDADVEAHKKQKKHKKHKKLKSKERSSKHSKKSRHSRDSSPERSPPKQPTVATEGLIAKATVVQPAASTAAPVSAAVLPLEAKAVSTTLEISPSAPAVHPPESVQQQAGSDSRLRRSGGSTEKEVLPSELARQSRKRPSGAEEPQLAASAGGVGANGGTKWHVGYSDSDTSHNRVSHGKPKLLEKATARLDAHRVMAKEKRKGGDKHKKNPKKNRKVIKVPEGAVLRGCKKTRRQLRAHLQLRAEIHSQLRVIASLFVLRIFLTCLPASMECDIDSDSESNFGSEPEPQSDSESERCNARLAALAPATPTGPPLPLDCEDPVMLRQLKDLCKFFANPNFQTVYNQLQRRLVRKGQRRHPMLMPVFEDPSNEALLVKLQDLGSINLMGDANNIDAHSMQLAVAMQQHYSNPGK
ncbi:hypothetical protein QJQ45_012736 [Haematococcus lacustris]|nr:hypothetical protein QJQ45_012736 [Haematococcus lacustris]